jgi:hypothetical protein
VIGDEDPEDGYDVTDPAVIRLGILRLVVTSILAERRTPRRSARRRWALGALELLAQVRDGTIDLFEVEDLRARLGA